MKPMMNRMTETRSWDAALFAAITALGAAVSIMDRSWSPLVIFGGSSLILFALFRRREQRTERRTAPMGGSTPGDRRYVIALGVGLAAGSAVLAATGSIRVLSIPAAFGVVLSIEILMERWQHRRNRLIPPPTPETQP